MATASTLRAGGAPQAQEEKEPWKEEFVMTWLELMEKQFHANKVAKEVKEEILKRAVAGATPDPVRQAVVELHETTAACERLRFKTDEHLVMDLFPALKRAKKKQPMRRPRSKDDPPERCEHCGLYPGERGVCPPNIASLNLDTPKDSLDNYLANGDSYAPLSPEFVADMSGWDAQRDTTDVSQAQRDGEGRQQSNGEQCGAQDVVSDDEVMSDSDSPWTMEKTHDFMIKNIVSLTTKQAPDFPVSARGQLVSQQQPSHEVAAITASFASPDGGVAKGPAMVTPSSPAVKKPKKKKAAKQRQSLSRFGSSSSSSSNSGVGGDVSVTGSCLGPGRISKREAANLVAKEILGLRKFKSQYEYQIRWENVRAPTWIAARKCPPQAKDLINEFLREYRPRVRAQSLGKRRAEEVRRNKKKGGEAKKSEEETPRGSQEKKKKKKPTVMTPSSTAAAAAGHRRAGNTGTKKKTQFFIVDHIVTHRSHYHKKQYLVRWDGYDSSEDTWENADKLRADVPDVVHAYEEQRRRTQLQSSAQSKTASKSKTSPKRRVLTDKGDETEEKPTPPLEASLRAAKLRRLEVLDEEKRAEKGESKDEDGDEGDIEEEVDDAEELEAYFDNEIEGLDSDEGDDDDMKDDDFDVEDAELEEYSEDDFMDEINA